MSSRLAFQTQLASIMEVLANAAVAEICKLVDDDYAVVSLQMSQCQRENKALKRKLHLLELKMARGNAERRLRESAMNSSRPRVHVTGGDRLRESASTPTCPDGGFEEQMSLVVWTGGAAEGNAELIHSERKSPDVELVEPELKEVMEVKGEALEANVSRVKMSEEEVVPLIRDDGMVECVPSKAAQRPGLQQQDNQSTSSVTQAQTQTQGASGGSSSSSSKRTRAGSRGVEGQALTDISSSMCLQNPRLQTQDHNPGTAFQGPLLTVTAPPRAEDNQGPDFGDDMDQMDQSKEEDVVLVKVEEVQEVKLGAQDQRSLSIQEGLVESSTDDFRAVLPFDDTTQMSSNQLSDQQESGRGFSEPAAPESPPVMSVQPMVSDPPTDPEQRSRNSLSSEYSLFDLESFFTRWAPDSDSVSTLGGPACSFTNDDSADCEQDGVIIVESEDQDVVQPPQGATARLSGGPSSAAEPSRDQRTRDQRTRAHGPSVSVPLRMQTSPSQPPRSRTSAPARSAQFHRISRSTAPSVSSTCRTLSSSAAPPVRGSTSASISIGIPAERPSSMLSRHNKSLGSSLLLSEGRRKSYVCRACGKAFSGLSNLEAHERVHTGEKPFHCETCGKRFSEAGNLKKHQRVHTGEKPFSCEQCGKRFAWICNLRTHQQSATSCRPKARGGVGLS